MAVYGRTYRRYTGELTPAKSRFMILPRYAYETVFQSKLFLIFFVLCFVMPFVGLLLIYLHHNVSALSFLSISAEDLKRFLPIDEEFFWRGMWCQGALSFVLVLLLGPTLVAPDLRNNGLPLYLSRPFSRGEYVIGKMSVLLILLSAITWVPGLLLFLFQGYLEGMGWIGNNLWIASALFVGSWAWILFLSLLALAVSAWVKWKPVARIAIFVLFFVTMGFGNAINEILGTWWGTLLSGWYVIGSIWSDLFGVPDGEGFLPPIGAAWAALVVGCGICLWLLSRRIRAYEVVR